MLVQSGSLTAGRVKDAQILDMSQQCGQQNFMIDLVCRVRKSEFFQEAWPEHLGETEVPFTEMETRKRE